MFIGCRNLKRQKIPSFWFKYRYKDIWKVKNILLQRILQNILKSHTFQKTGKFIMAHFYKMDFMKSIAILVKVDEKLNILKSLLSTHYCSRDEGGIGQSKILLESGLQFPFVYYVSALLRSSFIFLSQFLITFFIKFILSLQYDQHITFLTLTFEIHTLFKRTTFISDV